MNQAALLCIFVGLWPPGSCSQLGLLPAPPVLPAVPSSPVRATWPSQHALHQEKCQIRRRGQMPFEFRIYKGRKRLLQQHLLVMISARLPCIRTNAIIDRPGSCPKRLQFV